jgi:hypothetical protein
MISSSQHFAAGGSVHYVVGWGTSLPDIEEYLDWVAGRMESMPLTDEEKDRIREIERIRAEVQQEGIRGSAGLRAGPVVGACPSCSKPMRLNWQYCPFCGASSAATCPRCRFPQKKACNSVRSVAAEREPEMPLEQMFPASIANACARRGGEEVGHEQVRSDGNAACGSAHQYGSHPRGSPGQVRAWRRAILACSLGSRHDSTHDVDGQLRRTNRNL